MKKLNKYDNNVVTIDAIQKVIDQIFAKLKYPSLVRKYSFKVLNAFSIEQSIRLKRDRDLISQRFIDVYYALSSVQLSLGYMLLSSQNVINRRSSLKTVYDFSEIASEYNMDDVHFWHHANFAAEAIYRVWERYTNLLKAFFLPEDTKTRYFTKVVNKMKDIPELSTLPAYQKLRKQNKHWNKVAGERNTLSHQFSRLMGKSKIDVSESRITRADGYPYLEIRVEDPGLLDTIDKTKNRYLQCGECLDIIINLIQTI